MGLEEHVEVVEPLCWASFGTPQVQQVEEAPMV